MEGNATMDIRVSGHQVDTGEALKSHVNDRLQGIADKYFSRAISAHVTFGKGPHDHGFACDIISHVMQGVVLKGGGKAMDAHQAFDEASGKIEKQLRRYKRRLKDRHAAKGAADVERYNDIAAGYNANYVVFESIDEPDEGSGHPPVIAETRVDVPDATVSDAVMMLDLRNTNALLFRNVSSGHHNMVYRRDDGTIGWVEPAIRG
jgi:ribosomal subunit interface protein